MNNVKLLLGDSLAVLKTLPDESVDCCVTSPPYWGLRDYGKAEQLGLERTPEAYVENLVQVFREVRRVLKADGTLWLNLGDSYCSTGKGKKLPNQTLHGKNRQDRYPADRPATADQRASGLKSKDLVGIPWRVAFALQQDGWYLRSDIIWQKPNCLPESVRDRPTKSHEYIFLLSKSPRYYYDGAAIKEPVRESTIARNKYLAFGHRVKEVTDERVSRMNPKHRKQEHQAKLCAEGRNRRTVWSVAVSTFRGSHFATYPPELIRPCVRAGCRPGGVVLDPFAGSGTTGLVAQQEGRGFVGIELNPDYLALVQKRLESLGEGPGVR